MSISYDQYCILGVCIGADQIEVVDSEAIYEDQPRYDTKTGKVVKTERITVKSKQSHYELMGISDTCLDSLGTKIAKKCRISYIVNYYNDILYLGYKIGDRDCYGNVDLLDGSVDIKQILEYKKIMKDMFPDHEISLCFCNRVG